MTLETWYPDDGKQIAPNYEPLIPDDFESHLSEMAKKSHALYIEAEVAYRKKKCEKLRAENNSDAVRDY